MRHHVFRLIVGLALLLLLRPVEAQARRGPSLRFERLTIEQGLSQNSAAAILQDRQGFMWFGTLDGLNKYDGYEFTIYKPNPDDPTSISDKFITALYEDKEGFLWIGTDGRGLNRMDPTTREFFHYYSDPADPHTLSSDTITAIYEDKAGALWIGTYFGLNKFDRETQTFTRYLPNPNRSGSLSHEVVSAIQEDAAGTLWVGTFSGLNRFDPKTETFTVDRHDPNKAGSLSSDIISTLYLDRAGTFWIGTREGGLNKFNPDSGNFTAYLHQPSNPSSLSDNTVRCIYEDSTGNLWVGTQIGGLNNFDRSTERFTIYRHEPGNPTSLSSDVVLAVYQDRSGVLWIGTQSGGISKVNPKARVFTLLQHNPADTNSLSSDIIWSIYEDRQGKLWIGTNNGLNRYDPVSETFKLYQHDPANPQSLSHNVVVATVEDASGRLWFATDGGLNRFDPATGTFYTYLHDPADPHSLDGNTVGDLHVDRKGNLWVGTMTGLNLFQPETDNFRVYQPNPADPGGLPGAGIWAIYEDQEGIIWLGTGGSGLSKFDSETGRFTTYSHDSNNPNSISDNIVLAIYEAPSGELWVGTFGGGLNKFDRATETFTAYTERDGLPNNTVYGILADESGSLWLSTIGGLSRFNPITQTFRNYDGNDGLQSKEFSVRAYHQNKQGVMFFGGVNGLNIFDPAQLQDNVTPPPLALAHIQGLNQVIKPEQVPGDLPVINLSYQDYVISFEFAALDYTNPARNLYMYKLDGFDRDWVEAGTRRFATYTNLDGGEYVFRVKGSNSDGIWNAEGLAIQLYVQSPPWQTWWAYTLYGLIAALGVFSYVRYRTNTQAKELERQRWLNERLRQIDRLKDEFLAHTSHELRTPLNGIIGLTESLVDGATGPLGAETLANLQMVIASGRRLLSLVNNVLDFARLKHRDLILHVRPVDIYTLTEVVLTLSRPLIGSKQVELYNHIDPNTPAVEADENRIQQVMYNLIGNAVKYTEMGCIEVSARVVPDPSSLPAAETTSKLLAITVSDTGIGIPPDKIDVIFESFEQVDDPSGQIYAGTGLGLAITRQLVNLHGGEIWVESTLSRGSSFTFTLPLSHQQAPAGPATDPLLWRPYAAAIPTLYSSNHKMDGTLQAEAPASTILVVDDDPVNLQVLINQLSLHDYEVRTALNGLEAIAEIQGHLKPDLVILDVLMPMLSGYEVCRILRERYSLLDLPVLMLTAKEQVEDLVSGLEMGANDYLLKPFDRRELLARVEMLLELKKLNEHLQQEIKARARAQEALQRANEELEQRVEARTAELSETNVQLQQEVAERRQAEEMLARLVQDLDAFAHTVAHDLKGPVAIIIGYASLLLDELNQAAMAPENREMIQVILQVSRKLNDIIEALLLLARIRKEEIETGPLQMEDIVTEAQIRLSPLISASAAWLEVPARWPVAIGYAPWIEEVWVNYLSNAIKYGGRPPHLILGADPQDKGTIRFWVQDNGAGLAPEQQAQLFTPFKRFHDGTEGHGLGLSIVKRIIEKLGGQVGVESRDGQTIFYFTLPAALRD